MIKVNSDYLPIKLFQSHPKTTKLFKMVKPSTNKRVWISLRYHYRIQTINKNPPGPIYGPINEIIYLDKIVFNPVDEICLNKIISSTGMEYRFYIEYIGIIKIL